MSVSCADRRSSSWAGGQLRLILFWILLANLVVWWREPASLDRFFNPQFLPEGSTSYFIPDFAHVWASARCVFDGRPAYSEHVSTFADYLGIHRDPNDPSLVEVNTHPPTAVLLALPFGQLSFSVAFALWNIISLACLAVSLWLIVDGLGLPWPTWYVIPTTAILVAGYPLWEQSIHGDDNLILLLILTGMWAAARRGGNRLAGCLLGAAVAIKLFPAFVGIYFLARREWRLLFWSLISLAVLSGLTALIIGLDAYQAYFSDEFSRLSQFRTSWKNLSLCGFWSKLFDPESAHAQVRITPLTNNRWLMIAGVAVSAFIIVVALWRVAQNARSAAEKDFALGLTMSGMLLISPVTMSQNLLLIPLFVLTLWQRWPRREWMMWLFAILLALLWWPPSAVMEHLMTLMGKERPAGRSWEAGPFASMTALSAQTFALVTLFVIGAVLSLKKRHAAGMPSVTRLSLVGKFQERAPKRSIERLLPVLCVLILVAGFVVRFRELSARGLWFDEAFAWRLVSFSWEEMWVRIARDNTPPLYYLILKPWVGVFGSSIFAMRSLSVVLGMVAVAGMGAFMNELLRREPSPKTSKGRASGEEVATLTLALVALNIFQIRYSWEARSYALGAALAAWSSWALVRAIGAARGRFLPWLWYALLALLFAYTHYYALFSISAQALFAIGFFVLRSDWNIRRLFRDRQFRDAMLAFIFIGVGWLPWASIFMAQKAQVDESFWTVPVDKWDVAFVCHHMFVNAEAAWKETHQLTLIALDAGVLGALLLWRRGGMAAWLLITGMVLPFILSILISTVDTKIFAFRYFLFANLFFLAGLALLVGYLPYRVERRIISTALVGLFAISYFAFWERLDLEHKPGYRAAAEFIKQDRKPKPLVIVSSPLVYFSILYYSDDEFDCRFFDNGKPVPHYNGRAVVVPRDSITERQLLNKNPNYFWTVNIVKGHWGKLRVPVPAGWVARRSKTFPEALGQGDVIVVEYVRDFGKTKPKGTNGPDLEDE